MIHVRIGEDGERIEEKFVSDDPHDLAGPSYMVAEHVFDENDFKGCYADAEGYLHSQKGGGTVNYKKPDH